jgi:hypothetical protein
MRWPFSPPPPFIPAACLPEGHAYCEVCCVVTRHAVFGVPASTAFGEVPSFLLCQHCGQSAIEEAS